jgi:alkylation response protein AidB-like acyl-CoA dehydrogenase
MTFAPTEEQRLLQESARRFVERDYDSATRRRLVASEDGFDPGIWAQFAELGWLGVALPADYDGSDGGMAEIAVLMEAIGRGLIVEPFLSTVVLGAGLVTELGSDDQKGDLLPAVAAGTRRIALAVGEPQARYDLHDVATRAEEAENGYRLTGHKSVVLDAPAADVIVVSARTAGETRDEDGISAFLVDPAGAGVELRSYRMIDGLRGADILLDGAFVPADRILGPTGGALPALRRTADRAAVALGAEAVGIMAVLVEMTGDYLKTRQQFGTTLNRFQALQHRLVDMYTAHETASALTFRAAAGFDGMDSAEAARAASAVKAETGRAGKFVGQQAIQLHGGIGMTDEYDAGHYFKRLSIIDNLFGNTDHHLRRMADLKYGSATT